MKKSFLTLAALSVMTLSLMAESKSAEQADLSSPAIVDGTPVFDNVRISVGAAMRSFKKPKMQTLHTGSYSKQLVLGGAIHEDDYESYDSAWGDNKPGVKQLSFASFTGASSFGEGDSYDWLEKMGPRLELGVELWNNARFSLSAVGGFMFFTADTELKCRGIGEGSSANYFVFRDDSGNFTPNFSSGSTCSQTVDFDSMTCAEFSMDLYVLDAGLSLAYDLNAGFSAYVSAGLSFTFADIDSSSTAYTGTRGARFMGNSGKDNKTDNTLGYYVAVGLSFWFNEAYGITLEGRYDDSFDNLKTKYVEQKLDTFGAQLKLNVRY